MNVIVDLSKADGIFRKSIAEVQKQGWQPYGPYCDKIKSVILGTHKTYRYILVNGLLAKATNESCNPIVLQAGSLLSGAFDARSLCHNVVVPIERELLGGRLGASNEPFLNKPARFTELTLRNAVRRGNDTLMLENTIDVLSNMHTSEEALVALKDCIYWIFQRESRDLMDLLTLNNEGHLNSSILGFANDLVSKSIEGETCALLAGAIFNIAACAFGRQLDVRTHKVNQAGSSSREVSDIDVYDRECLVFTAEVKDKCFTPQDVDHAVSKVAATGHMSLVFIKGPRGVLIGNSEESIHKFWHDRGFNIYFVNIIDYLSSLLTLTNGIEKSHLVNWLNLHADSAKIKDETFNHLVECVRNHHW